MLRGFSYRLAFAASLVLLLIAVGCKKNTKKDGAEDSNPPSVNKSGPGSSGGDPRNKGQTGAGTPPAGWCEARDAVGGYRLYIPGEKAVVPDFSKAAAQETRPTGCYAAIKNPSIPAEVRTFSMLPPTGAQLGTAPDVLFNGLKSFNRTIGVQNELVEKSPAQLGGKPALKVVLKQKPSNRPKMDTGGDAFLAKLEAEQAAREKAEQAKRQVYYVTNTASRIVIIQVDTPGEPDATVLETVTESFAFL